MLATESLAWLQAKQRGFILHAHQVNHIPIGEEDLAIFAEDQDHIIHSIE